MDITRGYLLISDISGYTRFLVESELQHAKEILDSLLTATIDAIQAPIKVLNTRGDAVLAYVDADGFLQPQSLLESIEGLYGDFRQQLAFMDANTTCECNACANMRTLDLKLFLHFGDYLEQTIRDDTELQGADVILANLLLKNHVREATGLTGYALITEAAIEAMDGGTLTEGMTVHYETYEHFGQLGMRIWDLPAAYAAAQERRRAAIDPDDKWVVETVSTTAPPWMAWDYATDPGQKRVYYDMQTVERVDALGGPVREGSEYHCVHELGDVRFTITDWNPPYHFESDEVALGVPVHFTMQVEPLDQGSRLRIMYDRPDHDDPDEVEPLFRQAAKDSLARLAVILDGAAAP